MGTIPTSVLMEDARPWAAVNQGPPTCPEALGAIYMAHYRYVLQVCRRFFRQREDAEDAAAEVFLKLHKVLEKRDKAAPFRAWVSQVAGRHCIDKLRHSKRERNSCVVGAELSGVPDDSTPSPLSRVLRSEEQRQVREQLTRLPERYKVLLVLRYYKRMSYSEIARTLNRRLPAVKMMIFRAKDQLRRNLGRHQGFDIQSSRISEIKNGFVRGLGRPAGTGEESESGRTLATRTVADAEVAGVALRERPSVRCGKMGLQDCCPGGPA
jgi:RNA polymerase sigma-70 factor, ECF subfamily